MLFLPCRRVRAVSGASLPLAYRLNDTDKVCKPHLTHHCSWWPYNITLGRRLDKLQRSLISCVLRLPKYEFEIMEVYMLRRGRECAKVAQQRGLWSKHCTTRVTAWSDRLARYHGFSWAGRLYAYMDHEWFVERRVALRSPSSSGGKTGTRVSSGAPVTRFHDGVHAAAVYLDDARNT